MTTGASNDIERATDIARRMVTRWGFSKRLPPMQFDQDQDQSQYLGGGHVATLPVSDKTTLIIDEEVTEIINYCYDRAKTMLTENRDILEAMKDALLKYETIDAAQIDDLMNRRPCRAPSDGPSTPSAGSSSSSGSQAAKETKAEEAKAEESQVAETKAEESQEAPAVAPASEEAKVEEAKAPEADAPAEQNQSLQWPYNTPSGNKSNEDKKD